MTVILNGLYDVEHKNNTTTVAGHQPFLRDQLAGLYSNYVVLATTVKATFYSAGSGNNIAAITGIVMDRDETPQALSSLDGMVEQQQGVRTRLILPNSRERTVIRGTYSRKRFFTGKKWNDDDQIGTFAAGANPTDKAYCHLWMGSESALTNAIRVDYEIISRVLVFNPLATSSS